MDNAAELGVLIPILVPIACFAMVFGIVYLRNREKMAMIERGMDPRSYKPRSAPYQNLKWGLLLGGAGLGLCIAYMLDRLVFQDFDNPAMYFGLIALFGGLGLFLSYRIEKKEVLDKEQ
jgi:hypothetical protein